MKESIEEKKIDWITILLTTISISLLAYLSLYIYNYYTHNGILKYYPNEFDFQNKLLTPNEIGDSIGGILNPIIGFTAAILTFLAFYIQFRANQDQRSIYRQNLKREDSNKVNEHKVNLRIFKNLIKAMINHYNSFGEKLPSFIEAEKSKPLSSNLLKLPTDNSYEIFKNLDFKEIYAAIIYNFRNDTSNWEDEFTEVLRTIDFYDKLTIEITRIYRDHTNKKFQQIEEIGESINQLMNNVFSDNILNKNEALVDYARIILNKNPDNTDYISEPGIHFPDVNELQNVFFPKFLNNLYLNFAKNDINKEKYKNNLDLFSIQNKRLGNIKAQTINYATELEKNYKINFESKDNFKDLFLFLNKINCG